MKDAAGNEVHEGAILKVFHFIGARNRKHFMYKQVGPIVSIQNNLRVIYHLPIKDEKSGYYLKEDAVLTDCLIVECCCEFHIHNNLKTKSLAEYGNRK